MTLKKTWFLVCKAIQGYNKNSRKIALHLLISLFFYSSDFHEILKFGMGSQTKNG